MSQTQQLLSMLHVVWDATDSGLMPSLSGPSAAIGADAMPELIEALADEQGFIAAHVVLTRLSGVRHAAAPHWNGLAVTIAASGAVSIDPAQRFLLQQRWRRWFQSFPRPASLPD